MSRLATAPRRNRFVILRTAASPPVALHPASWRRSYLRLWSCDQLQNGLTPFRQNVLTDALMPRESGASSIPETSVLKWISRGVLDRPVEPGDDIGLGGNRMASHR